MSRVISSASSREGKPISSTILYRSPSTESLLLTIFSFAEPIDPSGYPADPAFEFTPPPDPEPPSKPS